MIDLRNTRIMVTRLKPQGEELCQRIQACGGEAIYFPTIEIEAMNPEVPSISNYDWLIFISPQAVYHFQEKKIPQQLKIAAVGAGTALALKERDIPVTVYPRDEWSSEGLLTLAEFQAVAGQKVMIVRGEGGREVLAQELETRGAIVSHLITYRRVLPEVDAKPYTHLLKSHKIDIIVTTSTEGIHNLLQLLGEENKPYLLQVPLVVVSQRLQAYAKELKFRRIIVAKNATHEAILEILNNEKGKL